MKAGKYYVSVLIEMPNTEILKNRNDGVGIDIDLGLKDFDIIRNENI